jgi:hypothetical protein
MTQKRQIGDPLELAATTGKIGRKQNANSPDIQTFESSEVQTPRLSTTQMPESSDARTPDISTTQTSEGLKVQTPDGLNPQTFKSSNTQTSELLKSQTAKNSEGQRQKHRGREQQTIYLPPHLIKKLKLHKALHDKEFSDTVAEALEDYFHLHQE